MAHSPKVGDTVRFRIDGINYVATITKKTELLFTGIPAYEVRGKNICTTLTQEQFT